MLNTGAYNISLFLQSQMCYMGQQLVFTDASQTLERLLGIKANAKQIERLCHHYGEVLEKQVQEIITAGGLPPKQNDGKKYYAMFDGGMLLTREEKWKEMKLARIFDVHQKTSVSKDRNYIGDSTYIAHLGGHKNFFQKVEHHLDDKGELIFIADGAKWIWKWVEAMYPESTQILDYYHAKQHLCEWAGLVFKNQKQKEKWIHTQCFWLLNNQVDKVIRNIKHFKILSSQAREKRKTLVEYYTTNQSRMQYKTFKEKGFLIGSGPIEAAHRHVIQQRMKLSGQRWTMKGAQQIANLRTANKGNKWNHIVELIKKAA